MYGRKVIKQQRRGREVKKNIELMHMVFLEKCLIYIKIIIKQLFILKAVRSGSFGS